MERKKMGRKKEKLTFQGILITGIMNFAGKIIGVVLIACFLWAFPGFRSLFTDHTFPAKDESNEKIQRELEIHRQEEERLKAELKQKEEALRQAEAQKQKDFIELCKSGNAKKVKEAIINGANVNAKDNDGNTALTWAALNGNTKLAEVLIKHGANVKATTNYGWTALRYATEKGRTDTAKLLRKYSAK